MLRMWILATLALLAWAGAFAAPAVAEELGLVVERTTPTQKTVPVVVRSDRAGPVEIRAYRVTRPDALLAAGVDLGSGRALVAYGTGADAEKAREADAKAAAHHEMAGFELVAKRRITYRQRGAPHLEAIRFERPGLYLLEARTRRVVARATALVSDLALVVKRAPNTTLVWATNRRTGEPWPGVALRTGATLTAAGTTGADGIAQIDAGRRPTLRLAAASGEHLAFGEETWFEAVASDRRVYAFAHQPAYRPGERVEVYGIVRAYEQGRYRTDPAVSRVSLALRDARGEIAHEVSAPVTADLGTFHQGFDLDARAPTGDWTIVVGIGEDRYEAPLRVAAYRKPAFEVDVQPTTPRVLAGEAALFDLRAAFYDGGVVAGAKVTWQLVYNRVDRELFPTDELVKLFFGAEREAYKPETLETGEGALDASGRLAVSVTAPPAAQDGYLTLRATVFGPDRIAVAGSGGIAVAAAPVRVDLETDKHLYGPEDEALVTIKVETADGRPAGGREGVFTLAYLVEGPEGDVAEAWARPQAFTTDARGEARLTRSLPREGRYRFMAVVPRSDTEPAGRPAQAQVHAWALADKPTLARNPGPLEVVADKDHYAVGETARLFVRAPDQGRSVLAALEGTTLLRHEVLPGAAVWTVRIDSAHAPNVYATFATVFRGELMLETRMLRVPPVERVLTATIEPDHDELEPGQTTGATIRITDHAGNPVANAALAVAFVDDALHGLYADPAAPIEPFFHSLRLNNVKTSALLHHDSVDWTRVDDAETKSRWNGAPGGRADPAAPASPAPAPSEAAPTTPASGDDGAPARQPAGEPRPEDAADMEESLEEMEAEEDADAPLFGLAGGAGGERKTKQGTDPLTARRDFRSCVHWSADRRTDTNGEVRVEDVQLADSLTRWRITVRSVDASTRVGTGTARFVARKTIAVDAAPPRFLRAGDRVEIPVLLRNLTKEAVEATLTWWTPLHDPNLPLAQVPQGPANGPSERLPVRVAAGATERRSVALSSPGVAWASIEATATSPAGGDRVSRTFPVLPQGIEKVVGRVIPTIDGRGTAELGVPPTATPGSIRCRVSLEASSVQAVVAALPYLLDYPHGCTEQTMNRFGPLADVAVAMKTLGVPVRGRLAELEAMQAAGLERLAQLQHDDGGFGWWESDPSSPVMTALVLRGLTGLTGDGVLAMRSAAIRWLAGWWEANAAAIHAQDAATVASVVLAVYEAGGRLPDGALGQVLDSEKPLDASPITQAWFLRAAHAAQKPAWVRTLRARLVATASTADGMTSWTREDPSGGAAESLVTRWQDDPIEATAEALFALGKTGAGEHAELLQRGATWLLRHRPGGDRWRSTRDTAAAVRFLAAHAVTTGALGTGRTVELRQAGKPVGSVTITKETLFDGASTVELPADGLTPGARLSLELVADGPGVVAGVHLTYFETGPAIRRADNGLAVVRRWYRLDPVRTNGSVTWTRVPVTETVPSGTLLECELVVTSPTPREYVFVQDPYAAGFEPVREYGMAVEGRRPASDAHVERYDDRTLFFLTRLPAGETVLRHLVRATHVGDFTALPAQAELMYFPDIRGNSDGEPLQVTEAGPTGVKEDR